MSSILMPQYLAIILLTDEGRSGSMTAEKPEFPTAHLSKGQLPNTPDMATQWLPGEKTARTAKSEPLRNSLSFHRYNVGTAGFEPATP